MASIVGLLLYLLHTLFAFGVGLLALLWLGYGFASLSSVIRRLGKEGDRRARYEGRSR